MITFESISWKNLLSTGNNPTKIDLNTGETTLIIGENGAGKSTILDALCFALFGKPFRRIKKPSLLNSVNGKKLVVELEFSTNGRSYKIIRGIKPNRFEIFMDDVMINQSSTVKDYQEHLEKFIIKMNYKSFTSIVILGSASFTPFMQLSAADRRVVIEDLLDIQVFSTMNVLVRQRMQENKEQLNLNKVASRSVIDKTKYIESNIASANEAGTKKAEATRSKILEMQKSINVLGDDILDIERLIKADGHDHTGFMNTLTSKQQKLVSLKGQIQNNKSRLERELSFYKKNETCSQCKQDLDPDFKENIVNEKSLLLDECSDGVDKLDLELSDVIKSINDIAEKNAERNRLEAEQINLTNQRMVMHKRVSEMIKELSEGTGEASLYNQWKNDLAAGKEEMKKLHNERLMLADQNSVLDITMRLLKDGGIKSKIIKQYLPVINKKVNQYLGALEFFVNFELDENFNETMKARHLDDFSYASFSEGEKMRIDLALLFTWRTVAKMRNSVHTNLLILDEVFDSSLDGAGTEEFLKIMMTLVGDTNVFVISHKTDQLVDKFDKVIRFEKYKNFSRIKE